MLSTRSFRGALSIAMSLTWAGCEKPPAEAAAPSAPPPPPPVEPTEAKEEAPRAPEHPRRPAKAGEEVSIAAGVVHLGSMPGSEGRNAPSEADSVAVRVPAFRIDRLPHPNDPEQPFTAAVDRKQAAALCTKEGKRLCHEVEWERACKGEPGRTYPTRADSWSDTPCGDDGLECETPFGVLRMGTHAREWTASDVTLGLGDTLRTAVVRGAGLDEPAAAHRCAARDSATPDSRSRSLTFRCCRGEAPQLTYPAEPGREPFSLKPMTTEEARELIRQFPEVRELAATFEPFSGDDYARALHKGGRTTNTILPWVPAEHPLVWSPVHGEEIWVLSGRTERGAVVLFAYGTQAGDLIFGGSFELENEPDPVVIAFNPEHQKELLWSSCWGCGGEGGAITLRDDGRVVIVQR